MAKVLDVAAYILQQAGQMSTMRLQKLVYYSQAWHLVWAEEALFDEPIQAWANGPVVYELFKAHRGRFSIDADSFHKGEPAALDPVEVGTIDAVLKTYGDLSGQKLSALTHAEAPWIVARQGLPATAASDREIDPDVMQEFYAALAMDEQSVDVDDIDWSDWAPSS